MAALSCSTFFTKAGWHCQVVQAGGAMATYISTPIVLPGGKPLDFYLIPAESWLSSLTMGSLCSLSAA